MAKHTAPTLPARICKLKKHGWGVALQLPNGQNEVVDGFDNKRQAKNYAAKAADVIAIRMGQGW